LHDASFAAAAISLRATGLAAARSLTDRDVAQLQGKITGTLIMPSSPRYDRARKTFSFNPRTDARPALIAQCSSEGDVMRVYNFARDRDLEVAVRSGGHDVLGASTVDGGVVIDLGGLHAIEPHFGSGLVHIGPGARSGDVNDALQVTNHAVALGCNSLVGVGGLTLGGGLGWLLGTAGAACDQIVAARLLTADGTIRNVSAHEEPDLFWAIRGGGGNFGIVASLTYRVRDVGRIVGGWIAFPGERLVDFLRFYREYMAAAPPELVVEAIVLSPSRPIVFAIVAFSGKPELASRVLAPLIRFGPPLANEIALRPYNEFNNPGKAIGKLLQSAPAQRARKTNSPGIYWMGASFDELSGRAIEIVAERLKAAPQNWAFNVGHYMHGAVCGVSPESTPFLRSRSTMTYHFDTYWLDVKDAKRSMQWVDASLAALKPYSRRSTYVNYLGSNDPAAVRAAYGSNYERLVSLKRRYDPEDVFHRNRNIRPVP
jgi:FAD/FMN-containing dehydrogenase